METREDTEQNMGDPTHLLLLCKDSSSSQTFFMSPSSELTSIVPRSFTSTFLARSEQPLLTSHRGLSGRTRQPKNITTDGTAAKPSMYLAKENNDYNISWGMGKAWKLVCNSCPPLLWRYRSSSIPEPGNNFQ